jgi:hypothetical protein
MIQMSLHACLDHIHEHFWHLPPTRFPLPHAQINPKSTSFWVDVSTNMERHKRYINDFHHVAHAKLAKCLHCKSFLVGKLVKKHFIELSWR